MLRARAPSSRVSSRYWNSSANMPSRLSRRPPSPTSPRGGPAENGTRWTSAPLMTRKARTMSEPANEHRVDGALEAILMVSDTPVPAEQLAAVLGTPVSEIREALERLARTYRDQGRGFELRELGQGW